MRPKIMPCKSIAQTLQYNEQKLTLGTAECILAGNFLKDLSRLTPEDKLRCFERRMELNERVITNQHITLNFDPLDKLSNEQMQKIAKRYLKEIGFERQPYLVYRHHDAGHPHCHIVTTHVRADGKPIEQYNIGRNQSEKARLLIEAEFNLVTKEMKQQLRQQEQKIDGIQRIRYGEQSIARSMSRVLEYVTENYKYTSLQEFNTVLRLYNLEAYRGKEQSQLYQHRGLLYRVLDEHGKYIGVPLKASFFDCKPTLDNLEKKFTLHQSQKTELKQRIATHIHWELIQHPDNLEKLTDGLRREDIGIVLQKDKAGNCKEVSYVDFGTRCILNGRDLGEHGNREAIQKVIDQQRTVEQEQSLEQGLEQVHRHHHSHRLL
ncbi:MAG TPA: relaxase/mobilization nuclease domain-containing protein [Puia sp.]